MRHAREVGRGVSVDVQAFEALKAGRMTVIYRAGTEWNRRKFLSRPVKWLYVCRTNETVGEYLKFGIKAVMEAPHPSDPAGRQVVAIQLGDTAEIGNLKTGERTFRIFSKPQSGS